MRKQALYEFAGIGALTLALAAGPAAGQNHKMETPKYGGAVEIVTVYSTISALSWDNYDYNWKHNHDTGQVYEQLFVTDVSQFKSRGGKWTMTPDAYIPSEVMRGELAEKWELKEDPLQIVVTLRKGIMFPEKPGVMASRELTADDIVYTFNRQNSSPKKVEGMYDYVDGVKAVDRYTVVFNLKEYNAEWAYRFGYGYYSGIVPKEVVDAGATNWKNVNGTGPFRLTDFTQGNSNVYEKNPVYWGSETINEKEFKLPYLDKLTYRIVKDEATRVTALRTGKIDVLELIRWQDVDSLKKSAPDLKWNRWLATGGTFLAMRVDTKPFDDIRVRRALNLAVNKDEIVKSYYNGNAELFAYPQHPTFGAYFRPLEQQPDSVKELFKYDPVKAKKLLAEAGYPNGFTFKTQVCSCSTNHTDLLPMVAGYLEQVGVKMEIQPMEYAAFLSAMTSRQNAPGYFMDNGHTNPTRSLHKSFVYGQVWNPSQWNDAAFSAKMDQVYLEKDEAKRVKMIDEMTTEIVDKAPYIWLPIPYNFTAWWPWVKGYEGELRAGAARPGPIYARMWIDQDLKKKMGY
ncbi:ABC transporter substrate-binding protein [Bradyrhizobium sp. LHD-71]|uniref:ABC transporter substrate-binding protein n=1 Tax=Bradyrhizobium sp. LHD-71 TaxID=3072141 RepID=UPI00280F442E|nr:ABC transporter substrate-binding protein [Bradyrhizobium sp. LHD-71]MDQ8727926.1 ABC transporter substrate-binding protein [Bradyrhizobium sp. LHD-71]